MLENTLTLSDKDLPMLATALDPDALRAQLADVVGLEKHSADSSSWATEVLKHWPGKRCTVRYRLTESDRPAARTSVIGKIYRRPELALRVHELTRSLRSQLGESVGSAIPNPLAALPELGLAFQEDVSGVLLSDALSAGCGVQPFADVGMWLASLHAAPPLPGIPVKPRATELNRLASMSDTLGQHLSDANHQRLIRAVDVLGRLADWHGRESIAITHRDFYPGNVLWDGVNARIVDFDSVALGEPCIDVGNFLAQIEKLSYRATGRWDAYLEHERAFYRSYTGVRSHERSTTLPFGLAAAWLNLANDQVIRQRRPQWRADAEVFAIRACQIAEFAGNENPS